MEINAKKILLGFLILFLVFVLFIVGVGGFLITKSIISMGDERQGNNNIAVINISGPIISGGPGGVLDRGSGANSRNIMKQINQAKDDKKIKALLLRINTPGGSSAASDSI